MDQDYQKKLENKIDKLIQTNQELNLKVTKIYHWYQMRRLFLVFKVIVILLIVISAWIYVPPFLEKIITPYSNLLSQYQGMITGVKDLENLKVNY